jgi:hypothetical protein
MDEKDDMQSQNANRRTVAAAIIVKCWKDPEFQKQVVTDPNGIFQQLTGKQLPPELKIVIHEEDANTLHFSIPAAPSAVTELSDDDLGKVAGGTQTITDMISLLVTTPATMPPVVFTADPRLP